MKFLLNYSSGFYSINIRFYLLTLFTSESIHREFQSITFKFVNPLESIVSFFHARAKNLRILSFLCSNLHALLYPATSLVREKERRNESQNVLFPAIVRAPEKEHVRWYLDGLDQRSIVKQPRLFHVSLISTRRRYAR